MEIKTKKIKLIITTMIVGLSVLTATLSSGWSSAGSLKSRSAESMEVAAISAEVRALSTLTAEEMQASTLAAEPVSPFKGRFMTNASDYVNVRAQESAESQLMGKLPAGSGGDVLERGELWSKISSGNLTGYVLNEFIVFDEEAEALANQICPWIATVNTQTLKVRKEPGTEAGVWGLVNNTESFTVTQMLDGWAAIDYNGTTGYLASEFIILEQRIATGITVEEEAEAIRLEQERLAAIEAEKQRQEAERQAKIQKIMAASSLPAIVQTGAYNVSEAEAYLLACVVHCEAGAEPYAGKLAVANVVLNRLNSGRYGNTITDVVYARGQFSIIASGVLDSRMAAGPNSESLRAAAEALSGVNNVPSYANFCATRVANYGSYSDYTVIGNHVFYRR